MKATEAKSGNLAMDRAPMTITAYLCVNCRRFHRKPSKKFKECYTHNEKHYGWRS